MLVPVERWATGVLAVTQADLSIRRINNPPQTLYQFIQTVIDLHMLPIYVAVYWLII